MMYVVICMLGIASKNTKIRSTSLIVRAIGYKYSAVANP